MASADSSLTVPADGFKKSVPREYLESVVVAVILALFIRTFVVQAFKIPTGSMENNLLVGDHLLVNKFIFAPTVTAAEGEVLPIEPIRRGDVVVFKFPQDPERDFIKRVIGLPGETLEIRNKRVFIDGAPLDEPYVRFLQPPASGGAEATAYDVRERYGPVVVPADHYFVMGDNRDNSQDSRWWGFLPRSYVKGRALVIYWSFDEAAGAPSNFFSRIRWNRLLNQIR